MGGSTALTACAVGLLQWFVLFVQLLKASVITPSSMGCCDQTNLQTYLLGKQITCCWDLLASVLTQPQLMALLLLSLTLHRSCSHIRTVQTLTGQSVLPRTTDNCELSQKRLRSFLFKSIQWKCQSYPSNCRYLQWGPISSSHIDIQKKEDESYSRIICILPLTK